MTESIARGSRGASARTRQLATVGLAGPHALLERIVLAAGLPGPAGGMPRGASVITLPRRAAPLPCDGRPAPSVTAYDQLLGRPRAGGEGGA